MSLSLWLHRLVLRVDRLLVSCQHVPLASNLNSGFIQSFEMFELEVGELLLVVNPLKLELLGELVGFFLEGKILQHHVFHLSFLELSQ